MLTASFATDFWARTAESFKSALAPMGKSIMADDLRRPQISNLLLQSLGESDLALLLPELEHAPLHLRQPLADANLPIKHLYFIQRGLGSMVTLSRGPRPAEVGLIGRDGVTGIQVVMGDDQPPFEVFVQMEGDAFRISTGAFKQAIERSETLRTAMLRYASALWIQSAYTAAANAQVRIEARLARWLLMVHDRVDGDHFELTHEFLALMLAVRRPGVTVALHELEGKALIRSTRGAVHVRDREGMMEIADGSYTIPERAYERLVGVTILRPKIGIVR